MPKPAVPYAEAPFHGTTEGQGRIFFWLAMVMTAILLFVPWINFRLLHRASYAVRHRHLVVTAICIDLVLALAVAGFTTVYRALGRLIARNNPAAATLDRLRLTLASFVVSLLMSGLLLYINGASSH